MAKKSLETRIRTNEKNADAPPGWAAVQEGLASASGLSLLLVDGHQPPALLVSNNNSICAAIQSSPDHVKLCDSYCGEAHQRALSTGKTQYKCHAGLNCFVQPVKIGKANNLAVIIGRAFGTISDYDTLVERFLTGDLKTLLADDVFRNVVFAETQQLSEAADRISKAAGKFNDAEQRQNGSKQVPAAPLPPRPITADTNELELEVVRLRSELEYRTQLNESLQHFLQRISSSDPEKTYHSILTNLRELLQAERASLFILNENNDLALKAADGATTESAEATGPGGETELVHKVLQTGKPLLGQSSAAGKSRKEGRKPQTYIVYPLMIGGRKIGVLSLAGKSKARPFDEVDLSLLDLVGAQVSLALERAEWQQRATEFQLMSITDPLTNLPNRRYLEERMNEELNRSKRYDYAMSFLMIDIDDFKSYNDLNGHPAGDTALQITAHCLKAGLRAADVASRYGGEEFSILLPQTSASEAWVIAERMRERVATTDYPHGKSQPLGHVTISIGISSLAANINTAEKIIAAADRALYDAKSKGKNRIEFYEDSLIRKSHDR